MGKQHLVSILRPIATEVAVKLQIRTPLVEVRKYVVAEVQKHDKMNSLDMQTIVRKTNESSTGVKLQQYLWDSLLKYEGCGVIT